MDRLKKPPIGEPCNACGLCCRVRVCSAGSFSLGLVEQYGDRADGPCPALIEDGDGRQVCGMVLRPRDYAPSGRGGAHDLRKAVTVLIGAGAGCDEAGEPPEPNADARLRELQRRYLEIIGQDAIERAAEVWFVGSK